MPFSDLLRMTKAKADHQKTDLSSSSTGDADFFELIWENGPIMVQGQSSSRARKAQHPTPPPPIIDANSSSHHTFPVSCETALTNHQDDDLVPWLNYPLLEPLNNDYCSGLLPELSIKYARPGINIRNTSTSPRPGINNRNVDNTNCVDRRSSIQYCPSQLGGSASLNLPEKHHPVSVMSNSSSSTTTFMNFSYLSRLASSNHRNPVTTTADLTCRTQRLLGTSSSNEELKSLPNHQSVRDSELMSLPNNHQSVRDSELMSLPNNHQSVRDSELMSLPNNHQSVRDSELMSLLNHQSVRDSELKSLPNHQSVRDSSQLADAKNHTKQQQSVRDSSQLADAKNHTKQQQSEPVVAASSICSRNSLEMGASTHLKRKSSETGESESPTEDNEEESVGLRVVKRSRAAQVHNLSERKRREKINEKMRALQELVPNCNKADKASMLDEAIEYLKTLQLQVQMLSMGTGFYIPPMMIPAAMQQISPFPPMPVTGMGMPFDMNLQMPSPCYPLLPTATATAASPYTIPQTSSTFSQGYAFPRLPLPFSQGYAHPHLTPSTIPHITQNANQRQATSLLPAQPQPTNASAGHETRNPSQLQAD